jgi:hypothetical protein
MAAIQLGVKALPFVEYVFHSGTNGMDGKDAMV